MAIAYGAPQNHQPNPSFLEEEDVNYVKDEDDNPVAMNQPRWAEAAEPMVRAHLRQWVSNFKLDILEFKGCLQPKQFLDSDTTVEEATNEWPFT